MLLAFTGICKYFISSIWEIYINDLEVMTSNYAQDKSFTVQNH